MEFFNKGLGWRGVQHGVDEPVQVFPFSLNVNGDPVGIVLYVTLEEEAGG